MGKDVVKLMIIDILLLVASTIVLYILDCTNYIMFVLLILLILNIYLLTHNNLRFIYWISQNKKTLVCADIDNKKLIKLYYGNKKEKELIKKVQKIIKKNVKGNGYFTKKTSDQFLILLIDKSKIESINIVNKIFNETKKILNDELFSLTISFGIHTCDEEDFGIDEDKTIIACNTAKKDVLSVYSFYDDEDIENKLKEKKILDNLVTSLKNNEFKIFYQPKYDVKEKKVIGSEALARLVNNGKIVPAKEFIDIAEKYDFSSYLDKYVLEEVCKDISEFKKEKLDFNRISINVSRTTLCDKSIVEYYESILKKYNVNNHDIELEITERNTTSEDDNIILKRIHEVGRRFDISIDDFGIGNSSLSMLMEERIDTIKIDRKFIIDDSDDGRKLLSSMIKIIKELGFSIIAEGVETKEQEEFLKNRGCNIIQGYYFSKPLTLEEYKEKMIEWGKK